MCKKREEIGMDQRVDGQTDITGKSREEKEAMRISEGLGGFLQVMTSYLYKVAWGL